MSGPVLQVVAHDVIGGTELKVALLSERLRASGMDVHVVFLDDPGPVSALLREGGVPVTSLGGGGGLAGAAWRLLRVLRSRDWALVEAYGSKASLIARLLALATRPRPVQVSGVMGRHVTEVVELDERKGRVALGLERATARLVDAYDVINPGALEMLAGIGIGRERLHYVPNGIDLSRWSLREEVVADGPPLILCAARFVPRKRQEDLVRALALLRDRGVECRALLAGTGPTLDAVRELVAELGLSDRVELPGSIEHERLRELMDEAAVYCLPSLWEGMPASLLEAMARGVPAVTTDVDGNRELVDDGVTGLLVPPRDPERLAAALEALVTDPERAKRMAAGARRLVEERYSFDRLVERKGRLYSDLVSAASIQPTPSTSSP
jgi:glycosyltransferase involved in cell wall biosynthesis